MIEALENDTTSFNGIKNLLKQVDILSSPPEVAEVVVDLRMILACVV